MNINRSSSSSWPALQAKVLSEIKQHPKKDSSSIVRAMDMERQPKMIFVSHDLRESLKKKLSESVKSGARVPRIVNLHRSQSLNITSNGRVPVKKKNFQATGNVSAISKSSPIPENDSATDSASLSKGDNDNTPELLTVTRKQESGVTEHIYRSGNEGANDSEENVPSRAFLPPDNSHLSMTPPDAPLRTSSVKKRSSSSLYSSQRSRTPSPPAKKESSGSLEAQPNLTNGFSTPPKAPPAPPAPPPPPVTFRDMEFDISSDFNESADETLKYFNRTVGGETTFSSDNSQEARTLSLPQEDYLQTYNYESSKGNNSGDRTDKKSKKKITKWSDKPKTVRASIKPGSVEELKKIFIRLGEENFKPSIIKKNYEYFMHVQRQDCTGRADVTNIFPTQGYDEDHPKSEITSKQFAKKYQQNWTEDEIVAPSNTQQKQSSTLEKDRALNEPTGIAIEFVTKDVGAEQRDMGHNSTVEKRNSSDGRTQVQVERNFEDENTSYQVDINEWAALGNSLIKSNEESVQTNKQRNSGGEAVTRNILIDSNMNLKPDEQLDRDGGYHVTTYEMSSAAVESYTFDSEQRTSEAPRGTSPVTVQSESKFTQQTLSSERFNSNTGNDEFAAENFEISSSERPNINVDSERIEREPELDISSSEIEKQKMTATVDMASFDSYGIPSINSSSSRYSTVTSDNDKHEKVYVVQDNVGDLYVVEDITDKTRETTTIRHPGQVIESTENESVRTLNTTDSSIRSFDFAGDAGTVCVETGVERGKAREVISTLFGDISDNKGLSFTEYPNDSLHQENVDLGRSLTVTASDLNSSNASGQKEIYKSGTEQKDDVLHEDTYEKTVLNIVTDNSNKPLWTETTTDTQTCAWLENNRGYERGGGGKTYVTTATFGDRMPAITSDSVVIPEPDYYPKEMTSSGTYSTEVEQQNENSSLSLVPLSSSYGTVAVHNEPVTSQQTEQTSIASGEINESQTESEITITTRTTAVVGELVDMHIGIPPDLQSSLKDISSTTSSDHSPRRSSSIIRLRTKSPESTSPRSGGSLNNSRTRVSDITETTEYIRDRSRSPDRRSPRRNSGIITANSGSYNLSSPERIRSYPDKQTIELVNGFDDGDDGGQKYRIVTSKREYDTDRDSSYRKDHYYEEYLSKSPQEPKHRRSSPTHVYYTSGDPSLSTVKPDRYHGETDSQYSSKGTSSGVPSIGDDQPQYRVSHIELSPPGREPHRKTYREIESTERDADYYTVNRIDTGGDLWRVNSTARPDAQLPNTSITKVFVERLDGRPVHPKTTYKIVRSLSDERLDVRKKRLSSGFKSGSQSDSEDEGRRVYKTVKTFQIGKSQGRPRRQRRGSQGSSHSDTDGDDRGTHRYRVSNIDENTLLEKEWKRRVPDDGKKHVYRVVSPSPSSRREPRAAREDRDDSRIYRIGRKEPVQPPPKKNPLISSKKIFHETSTNYHTKSTPSHFDSGYFDDNQYWSKSPSHRNVLEIDPKPRRSRSFDANTNDSLYRVVNVESRDNRTPDAMRRVRRRSPNRFRSGSLSSDSDEDNRGKYYITSPKHERKSPIRESHEPRRRPTKEKNIYYVHRTPSPENVNLKRVRSLSPERKFRISNHTNDESDLQFVTSSPSSSPRNYVVYNDSSAEPVRRSRSPKVTDSQTYRTEKTIVLQPSRNMSPRLQHKGVRYFTQNGVSMDQTIDSGTGTEIASSDNEGNGETIHQRMYERVEEIYEVRKEPQYVDLVEDVDGSLKVQRGKILIQNQMDPNKDDDDFDDNINVFDNSFHLQKDNPLYQSDPDIYKSKEDYDNQDAFQQEVTQDITFDTVNKIAQAHSRKQEVVPQTSEKSNLSTLLLSRLANIDSKDIRQTINVEHHNEEIYGDIEFIHAGGERTGSANTTNFDAVNENVGLTLRDGKAFVTIKVVAERIVPIDYEFNVWRKSSAIVTRQIEIDLLANEQRSRLYHHVMENAGLQGAITGSFGPEIPPRFREEREKTLSSLETLKLFSQILNVAEGQTDNDEAEFYTRQEQGQIASSSAFDILY